MGWLDNLDADLQADDQPGCSGLSRMQPAEETNSIDDSDTTEENEQQEKEDPIRTFAEKVTIAGLEEAYKAEFRPVRVMFQLALLTAFAIIIYESNIIADQYHDTSNIVISKMKDEPPFPNISICFPPLMNITANAEKIHALAFPDRLTSMMRKFNTNFSISLDFLQGRSLFDVTSDSMHKPMALMARMLYDALRLEAIQNGQQTFDLLEYPCSGRISNCDFDKQSIDCCQFAQHLDIVQKRCLNLQPDKMKKAVGTNGNELLEFTFHAMIDWTFGHDSMPDGFDLFVGKMPSQTQVPITVPSGMDVVVALAQAKNLHQVDNCWPTEDAPKLKYFDYYDQEGMNCLFEKINDVIHSRIGCKMPGLSYTPLANESCSFSQLSFILLVAVGDFSDGSLVKQKQEDDAFKYMTDLAAGRNSHCKPLCTRWISPVHSTSYGQITYSHHSHHLQFETQNKSWSRIRIIMPDPTYMDHQEMKVQAWYLAMCHIGGMMCVYAGFSAITIIQIIAYGAYVVWWKCKNREEKDESAVDKSQSSQSDVVCETAF